MDYNGTFQEELEKEYQALLDHKNEIDQERLKLTNRISWLSWFSISLVVLGVVAGILPFFKSACFREDQWNLYGDYIGGSVAALWSLAGLIIIYIAFIGQKQQMLVQQHELRQNQYEIKATRLEITGQRLQMEKQNATLTIQRFENTFFQLLQLHNDIVNSIDIPVRNSNGRDCFKAIYELFSAKYVAYRNDLTSRQLPRYDLTLSEVGALYLEIYNQFQSDLGHYFRNLYNIFRFINDSTIKDKHSYSRFVRAQLSSHELLMIFYNCLTKNGWKKFKPLIEEYRLLKNMNWELVAMRSDLYYYEPSAFGRFIEKIYERVFIKFNYVEFEKTLECEIHVAEKSVALFINKTFEREIDVGNKGLNEATMTAIKAILAKVVFDNPNWIKGHEMTFNVSQLATRLLCLVLIEDYNDLTIPVTGKVDSTDKLRKLISDIRCQEIPHYKLRDNVLTTTDSF